MAEPRAEVRNAADPDQVKGAGRRVKRREQRFLGALRASLQHPDVRLVFAEFFERAGLFTTSYDHSGSLMYFKEGRRNFGLEWRALCETADARAVDLMDQEQRARKRRDGAETDASHTAAADGAAEEA